MTTSEMLELALRHHRAGSLSQAEDLYRQILQIDPQHVDALHLLGGIAYQLGQFDQAIELIRQALQLKPNFARAHFNLGLAFGALGRFNEAEASYRQAIDNQAAYVEAHFNLGHALAMQDKLDEAAACFAETIRLKPEHAAAHYSLGTFHSTQGRYADAVNSYRQALGYQPGYAAAFNNLGVALAELGELEEAVACYRQAIRLDPSCAETRYSLGNALFALERLEEATASYREAVRLKPADPGCLGNLVHALQHMCQWQDISELAQRTIDAVQSEATGPIVSPAAPFGFVTLPIATTPEQQLRCARQWTERRLKSASRWGPMLPVDRPRGSKSKLTLGYLSPDFRAHATAYLIAELFEKHDRGRFEVFAYSYGPDDGSAMRQRLISAVDRWADLQMASRVQAARRIAGERVDILIDLAGYVRNARSEILALRPAPIQVNYLGYPGTMGAPFMDFILVDDFVVPADQQPFFAEKLVHLPGCYQVNDSRREVSPSTPTRTGCGLPEEGFVFCSFNNSFKITPAAFGVWMELLKAVQGSVLWLLEGNRFASTNLRREAEARGVLAERLVFARRLPLAEHLARHRVADLCLDTFPMNGHTTTSDALWMGCPVVTLSGETFASRVAGSLLRAVDLSDLINQSLAQYQDTALRLAQDSEYRAAVKARLEAGRTKSDLFDGERFARNVEQAYLAMWESHSCLSPMR